MVLSLAGCHRPVYPVAPSVPPAESGIDLQLDAQTRSLQEAYRAYVQGRYSKASILFKRFVETNSRSPRLSEARWWLARSYEAQGNIPAAVAEYRALAGASATSNDAAAGYQAHAVRRLADIMQTGGAAVLSGVRPVVLSMTRASWNRIANPTSWIAQVRKAGVTALLVDAGPSMGDPEQSRAGGVYFKTSRVPVIDDVLGRVIPLAHAEGVAVFARIDVHQASWISPKPDSVSTAPSPSATMPQSSNSVDVLHPEYQQIVGRIVDDLCRTGIDGLVLQARMRKGFAEEISPTSQASFERKFGQAAERDPTSPFFWKWAGWKAHSYLRFVEELKDRARRERATLLVAVTVHASAVLDPKAALMDYGEDLLESRLKGFEVVVLPESEASNGSGSGRTELTKRMAPMIQGERPLWLGTPLTLSDPDSMPAAISATLTEMSDQPAIPLVLMNETAVP
jgi:hypothetical protein